MSLKIRSENPPKYTDYRRYKPFLRREFYYSCYICGVREAELGGQKSFHVEHYRPQKLFERLKNNYSNLLYACRDCNSWKGSYWPSLIQRLAGLVVLNPFLHDFEKHLDTTEFKWRGKTSQGRWNVEKFRLDSASRARRRKDRQNIEKTIQYSKELLEMHLIGLRQAQIKNDSQAISKFQLVTNDIVTQIDTLTRKIDGPTD